MADKRLQRVFKEAAELARDVPEELREAAFNRAVDMLLMEQGDAPEHGALGRFGLAYRDLVLESTVEALNFASRRFGRDELTADQLADAINERLGVYIPTERITRSLATADGIVKAVRGGGGTLYRLVRPAPTRSEPASKASPKGKASKGAAAEKPESPTKLLTDLLAVGFFNTARTATDVLVQMQRKGLNFSIQQVTPAMMQLMRAGMLSRRKNRRGVYEYKQA